MQIKKELKRRSVKPLIWRIWLIEMTVESILTNIWMETKHEIDAIPKP